MKQILAIAMALLVIAGLTSSCSNNTNSSEKKATKNIAQWRGTERDGAYNESGLLKKWPEEGPALLWSVDTLIGNGYGSPVVSNGKVLVMGEIDSVGVLFAFDLNGKLLWKSNYGKEWATRFPGSRSTPTITDKAIYTCSGHGQISCFDEETGKQKWVVDMIKDLHGRNVWFGYSESVLVDEQFVYCMPGGKDTNMVALNKTDGKIAWVSKGAGEIPSYCSPLLIQLPQRNILVTYSERTLLGIDTKDGNVLWTIRQMLPNGNTHGNTPIFEKENGFNYLYTVSGDGNGTERFKISDDGSKISRLMITNKFDNVFGGFVKMGKYLYGSGYEKKRWNCVDAYTGEIVDTLKFNRGITIAADSMLYAYNEKGEIGLIKPGKKMELISKFQIKKGTKEHFAHPAIVNGVLYVRHGKALMAYNIKK